ncbi:hemolysin family protein [Sanguibacter massiliensis]|uniref:hemolysin family protein n=1 Tax=Sanguibacter massiliensis TaxID=1973217 RepID=UPI000C81BCA8|nr:hemolysin family protein [Sanguibacter massiliensis]
MDQDTVLNVLLVIAFVLVGGVFAATELALVSLREGQIDKMEKEGGRAALTARLARDPNRFLAAVQIGVTVAGFLSAAYGASTLAPDFAPLLVDLGLSQTSAATTALIVLTLVIAYLSLVLGELVPKRLAMQHTEKLSRAVGPPLDVFARLMRPVVWLLSKSTNGVVRLLGGDPNASGDEMSEEELRGIVTGHEGLAPDEKRILGDVLDAGARSLAEVMRPRTEVEFMSADLTVAAALDVVADAPYSRYPVIGENFDDILGFLHVRDLLRAERDVCVRDLTRDILLLPSTNRLLPSMSQMRRDGVHIAVVVDEYGGTDGIVTLEDLVEELVGDIRDEYDADEPAHVRADDGVVRLDAGVTIEEFAEETGVVLADGPYETAAGFVVDRLGRLAEEGDEVEVDGAKLRVAEVDNRRIRTLEVTLPSP